MSRQQQDAYVAEEFNRAAASYDDSPLVRSYQYRVQALVVDSLDIKKGMNVLDLGCGTGWATLEIASRLEGTGKVVGLDLSEGMIEQARQKLPRFRYDNVEFVLQSAGSLNYAGSSIMSSVRTPSTISPTGRRSFPTCGNH